TASSPRSVPASSWSRPRPAADHSTPCTGPISWGAPRWSSPGRSPRRRRWGPTAPCARAGRTWSPAAQRCWPTPSGSPSRIRASSPGSVRPRVASGSSSMRRRSRSSRSPRACDSARFRCTGRCGSSTDGGSPSTTGRAGPAGTRPLAGRGSRLEPMDTPPAPDEVFAFWEDMYRAREGVWSGHVNAAVADVAGALPPGRAIDLGAGEGGDALWLAERGWTVTGVDVSPTALARAQAAAERAGLSERITWVAADLHTWRPAERVDLVTAAFFQSPVALERATILRVARGWV